MKIGIIFAIYNCEEFVDDCLEPWLKLRESYNLILAATSGQFKPYYDIGIKNKNQKTISKLVTKELDFIVTTAGKNLIDEDSSRNMCLDYLKPHNCDIIWVVDGDELYTEKQIIDIVEHVKSTPEVAGYAIYFKNYTTKYPYFIPPWSRPTVFRNKIYGGISKFWFDNDFNFEDGHSKLDIDIKQIPKHIAFVEHYSWTTREATIDKIKYQKIRYASYLNTDTSVWTDHPVEGRCMCEHKDGEVYLSEKFYKIRGAVMPSLHEYPTNVILEHIIINYDRSVNKIKVTTEIKIENHTIIIKNISTAEVYHFLPLNISPYTSTWYVPDVDSSSPDFSGYWIEIRKDNKILHIETIRNKMGVLWA